MDEKGRGSWDRERGLAKTKMTQREKEKKQGEHGQEMSRYVSEVLWPAGIQRDLLTISIATNIISDILAMESNTILYSMYSQTLVRFPKCYVVMCICRPYQKESTFHLNTVNISTIILTTYHLHNSKRYHQWHISYPQHGVQYDIVLKWIQSNSLE